MQMKYGLFRRSVSAVFLVIVNSFAVTTGSLVSNAIGAGERRAVFIICRKILRLGYSAGFPLIGVAVCYNRLIIGIYTDNELLTEQAFIPFVVTLLNCLARLCISQRSWRDR